MVQKQYIVTGESEDGWFYRELTKSELEGYLAVRTGDSYEEGDPIDFNDIARQENAIGIDGWYYTLPNERFIVIDGDKVELKPKQMVTELDLE